MADNAFNLKGAKAVASSIRNMPKLEVLNLADLSLTCEGTIAVCRAIQGRDSVKELYLAFNEAGEEGALEIAKTIESLPNLRVLNLECNEFGDEGYLVVFGFEKCQNLESLNLKTNEIENAGARKIANSVPKSFKILNMDENDMSPKTIKKLKARFGCDIKFMRTVWETKKMMMTMVMMKITYQARARRMKRKNNRIRMTLHGMQIRMKLNGVQMH